MNNFILLIVKQLNIKKLFLKMIKKTRLKSFHKTQNLVKYFHYENFSLEI